MERWKQRTKKRQEGKALDWTKAQKKERRSNQNRRGAQMKDGL